MLSTKEITFDESWKIIAFKNILSGTLPTELGNLQAASHLMLAFNELTGTIPTEIGLLTSLSRLDLPFNSMVGTIPSELGNLSSMSKFHGQENLFNGTVPTEICENAPSNGGVLGVFIMDCLEELSCGCCSFCL